MCFPRKKMFPHFILNAVEELMLINVLLHFLLIIKDFGGREWNQFSGDMRSQIHYYCFVYWVALAPLSYIEDCFICNSGKDQSCTGRGDTWIAQDLGKNSPSFMMLRREKPWSASSSATVWSNFGAVQFSSIGLLCDYYAPACCKAFIYRQPITLQSQIELCVLLQHVFVI